MRACSHRAEKEEAVNAQAAYIIARNRQQELIHEAAQHRLGRQARQSRLNRHVPAAHLRVSLAAVAAVLLALTAILF
jgi:hypothetical protein